MSPQQIHHSEETIGEPVKPRILLTFSENESFLNRDSSSILALMLRIREWLRI